MRPVTTLRLIFCLNLVFDPHPSPWHRYGIVCGGTSSHIVTVEVAPERCRYIIGHSGNQHRSSIQRHRCGETIKLCLLRYIVRK